MVFKRYLREESGASAAEYVLIIALVAVVLLVGLSSLGTSMNNVFAKLSSYLNNKAESIPAK
ncbi:MAG: Flp family type IVb pilin [Holosporales bacterium]